MSARIAGASSATKICWCQGQAAPVVAVAAAPAVVAAADKNELRQRVLTELNSKALT